MSDAKAKTISLLLEDGTLKGVMCIEDSSWNSGELYSAPKESINELMSSEACKKFGVYLLLSEDMVYVGQSMDLATRIKQHLTGKDWWERAIVLTTKDDSLNRSDIDYLESVLIRKANENNRLDCDNKKKGNPQKVTRFRKVELEQYLEEAYLLMELIGVSVFCSDNKLKSSKIKKDEADITKYASPDFIQGKSDEKKLLEQSGVIIEGSCNYAKRQKNRKEFWINPNVSVIDEEWDIILNNQYEKELIYIHVPAKTFRMSSGRKSGFFVRNDKPLYIDLNIMADNNCDRRSGYDFSPYIVKRVKYGN
ncbi:hypothetical protein SAMN02910289_00662 [Lachnospiraceae bacterium RM5]|nr:hypothetical protein SAMN02910289_00662 [Lachnospiraceae bacterium RM5]